MEKYLISEAFDKLSNKKLKENLPDDKEECKRLAMNPNTPPDILLELANDEDLFVRREVASNPNTPPDILSELANDSAVYVRFLIVKNPNTSPETLKKLANDEDEDIKELAKDRLPYEVTENEFGYTDDNFDDYR